jgi:glycosyltransferase involved in cell wall biosynthesis
MYMSIVLVTTWNQECGIATYSEALTEALQRAGERVTILAERDPSKPFDAPDPKAAVPVYRVWDRRAPANAPLGLQAIVRTIESSPVLPKVVHFQHEFGLFPRASELFAVVKQLVAKKIKVVMTLHTVNVPPDFAGFFHELSESWVDLIVHTTAGLVAMKGWNARMASWNRITKIPHGVKGGSGTRKGIPNLFLCPGFMGRSKGQLGIAEAAAHLRTQTDSFHLAFVGRCRDRDYQGKLDGAIFQGAGELASIHEGFHPDSVMADWFASAQAVILGAGDTTPLSASGQLHTALGFGLPVLAKNVPIYREGGAGVLYYDTPEECAFYMQALLDKDAAAPLAEHSRLEGISRSWQHVADMHRRVYFG